MRLFKYALKAACTMQQFPVHCDALAPEAMSAFYTFLLLLSTLVAAAYLYLKHHYNYWQRHNVAEIQPTLFTGNFGGILRMNRSPADFIRDLYNHPQAKGKTFVGIHVFQQPALLIRDPTLIKQILIKDFAKFSDRYSNSDQKGDPLGTKNIFFLRNPAWKEVRLKLSPFFTSVRLKHMFNLIDEVGRNLNLYLRKQIEQNGESQSFTLELKEFCALYTTDVIASVAYGITANSFVNPNGEFRRNGREIFRFNLRRAIQFVFIFFIPKLVPYLRFKIVPPLSTHFLRSTFNYVMEQREKSGQKRNDLIDILIDFKNSSKLQPGKNNFIFEGDVLVAQAAIFFTAGFETSSATMSFALYELAKNQDLQSRLREEVRNALVESNGEVTQQLIDSLEYMQMVIHEVLRLYPPLPFLDRECTVEKDAQCSLLPFSNYAVPNGMPVYIPVYGLQRDSKFYPQPDEFNPERFSAENKKRITPYTYMPFGLGPHGCIGERFAMIQVKIGLVYLLRNHYVATCDKTRLQMKLDPKAIIVQAEGGIHLNVVHDPLNI